MIAIAIFASGAGSNAQKIIDHFRNHALIKVALIVCNNPKAGVIEIARQEQVPVLLLEKQAFFAGDGYLPALQKAHIDWLILAGFLWKVPRQLTQAYTELQAAQAQLIEKERLEAELTAALITAKRVASGSWPASPEEALRDYTRLVRAYALFEAEAEYAGDRHLSSVLTGARKNVPAVLAWLSTIILHGAR